ncbi:MAG: SPOR domain-containing protein [Trueperaceae bacterium]
MLATVGASAQAISFTVQVIAVSDQATAVDISRSLLRDGFPAYVVRSTGGQGDVYRVRVGAFANRAAAVRYAAAMPDVAGARPVPALAEAIPGGIMPLAPRVLWEGSVGGEDLRVLPWPDGVAVRRQVLDPLRQATYTLVQGDDVRTVRAWRLAPLAELPSPPGFDLLDVPFIDLTLEPATEGEPAAEGEPTAEGEEPVPAAPAPTEGEPAESASVPGGDDADPDGEGGAGEVTTQRM